jgi:AcrR family transcriptional regulator
VTRQRTFDRGEALNQALQVFWEKGYAATSTADLLQAMQIGRQSMYDAFGDKRALYLEALRQYGKDSIDEMLCQLAGDSALGAIDHMLQALAMRSPTDRVKGCMGVNAISEFGTGDDAVNALRAASGMRLQSALEEKLRGAVSDGEVAGDTDIAQAAVFVLASLSGMKIAAKSGAGVDALCAIARFTIQALRAGGKAGVYSA